MNLLSFKDFLKPLSCLFPEIKVNLCRTECSIPFYTLLLLFLKKEKAGFQDFFM